MFPISQQKYQKFTNIVICVQYCFRRGNVILYLRGGENLRNSIEVAKFIEKILEAKGMKPAELARRTGVDRSTISRYFKGERKIPMDEIPKFALALDLSPEELLINNTSTNSSYISKVPENNTSYHVTENNIPNNVPLSVYGEIYCGEGEVHYGYPLSKIDTPKEWLNGGEYFYLIAKGDSMIGAKINEDDLLLIRKQPIVENGEIAAVVVGDKRMLKRVYKTDNNFTLVSENPIYPPIIYKPDTDEHIRIIGKLKKSITNF